MGDGIYAGNSQKETYIDILQVIVRRELILTFAFWKGVNNVLTESVRKGGTQPHTHCIDNRHQKDFCPYL